jgi:hypothetical protein
MFRRMLLLTLLIAAAPLSTALAAESVVEGTFTVGASPDAIHAWYEKHRSRIFTASNCNIVERRENQHYLVKTDTPLGECRYVVREINNKTDTGRTTLLKFDSHVKGRIHGQTMMMTITDQEGGCQVRVRIYTDFRGFFVTQGAVKDVQDESYAAIKQVMQDALGK